MHRVQCMRQMQKRRGYALAVSKRRWQRKAYGDIRSAVRKLYEWLEEQEEKREKAKNNPPEPKPPPKDKMNRECQFKDKAADNRTKTERMEAASRSGMRAKFKSTEKFFMQEKALLDGLIWRYFLRPHDADGRQRIAASRLGPCIMLKCNQCRICGLTGHLGQ